MTDDAIERAARRITAGGVVAAASESVFGLLADATDPRAVERVLALKARPEEKGILVLLPERAAWAELVIEIDPLAERLADAFWPGPLTIALPARAGLHERLTLHGTIGVRLPGACPAAAIARRVGRPLTATSANPPGQPPRADAELVKADFAPAIARGELEVVERSAPGGSVSTLVAVRAGALEIVREGAIQRAQIERALRG